MFLMHTNWGQRTTCLLLYTWVITLGQQDKVNFWFYLNQSIHLLWYELEPIVIFFILWLNITMSVPWVGIKLFELELYGHRLCHFLLTCACSAAACGLWTVQSLKEWEEKRGIRQWALGVVQQYHCFSQIGKLQNIDIDAVFNNGAWIEMCQLWLQGCHRGFFLYF